MKRTIMGAALAMLMACGVESPDAVPEAVASQEQALGTAEQDGLLFVREEEKLARDVYQALSARWGAPIFANIAVSEQQHMDAVLTLLNRYGLADPAAGQAPGRFVNPELQALYTQLMAQGTQSLHDALTVGATIEDYDLADIAGHATATTRPDILRVYANLSKGSRNHLRAFYGQLAGDYAPQFLDLGTFTAIVTTATETGPAR